MTENRDPTPAKANTSVVVSTLTPHSKAVYDAGRSLLIESVKTGREFCKFMIGFATGAIPTYLALLKFALTGNPRVSSKAAAFYFVPPALFLAAAVVFVIGFFPQSSSFSLDIVEEIERERSRTIKRRRRLSVIGFIAFCLAAACAILILTFIMTGPQPPQSHPPGI